jgi:hypothetical protein
MQLYYDLVAAFHVYIYLQKRLLYSYTNVDVFSVKVLYEVCVCSSGSAYALPMKETYTIFVLVFLWLCMCSGHEIRL